MNVVNIHNDGYKIWLFKRTSSGELEISQDDTFRPFFYEPSATGSFVAYDGTKLKKVTCDIPAEIPLIRSPHSYSSDIIYTKNYIVHKIDQFTNCPYKYFFIDIEILSSGGLPSATNPKDPVSCITVYNSATDTYKTWWLKDYGVTDSNKNLTSLVQQAEKRLLNEFAQYIATEKPDLWLSWNVDFDYNYLFNRWMINTKTPAYNINFAAAISPIAKARPGHTKEPGILYPAGISILDYLKLFKKVFMREASYKLDYIAQKHLKETAWVETDFGSLVDLVRDKNINDVKRMVELEQKFKILEYFNEIRLLCTSLWEDSYYNSFLIEMILFRLAKKKGVVLPNIPKGEKETFQGATREIKKTGALYDIGKFDLSSAYPSMIVNFCLDPVNITKDTFHPDAIEIDGTHIIQDPDALCPSMVKELLFLKDKRKAVLETTTANTPERKEAKRKYDAIKGVVNSAFGVMALHNFRLHSNVIASIIASLARQCLTYCKDKIGEIGYEVVYWDTDSIFLQGTDDVADVLNDLIKTWGEETYGKCDVDVEFSYEGYFRRLFLLTRCRYIGELVDAKTGEMEEEIKGVEIKRSSSTEYEKKFQRQLFNLVLDGKGKAEIVDLITAAKAEIKNLPIQEIAFPCKIANLQYENVPIFVRAANNTKALGKFDIETGELFYYVYVKPIKKQIMNSLGFPDTEIVDVLAFKNPKTMYFSKDDIDWEKMIDRNITSKAETIFEAMGWTTIELQDSRQTTLF